MIQSVASEEFTRVIGRFDSGKPGPCLVCAAGLHGNEPAGVRGLQRVFQQLHAAPPDFRGQLVGLCGNLAALRSRQRFIDLDFNRIWTPERIRALSNGRLDDSQTAEDREQFEFLRELNGVFQHATGDVFFIDMHTSSARGTPFACIGDTLRNRALAFHFPVPTILGLEEHLDGTLLEYVNNQGHVTLGFEGGQHDEPAAVDFHEAAVWIALVAAGNLRREDSPDCEKHFMRLRDQARSVPAILEVRYRHGIEDGDDFRMEPDYDNFQHVDAGRLLARDRHGEICATEPGRILLPLYQGQGDDGFFLVREVRKFWLRLSAAVRRLHLDGMLHLLPGVRRHPAHKDTLLINPRVAHYLAIEFFHLFGYRKLRPENGLWVVSRRTHDIPVPTHAEIGPMT